MLTGWFGWGGDNTEQDGVVLNAELSTDTNKTSTDIVGIVPGDDTTNENQVVKKKAKKKLSKSSKDDLPDAIKKPQKKKKALVFSDAENEKTSEDKKLKNEVPTADTLPKKKKKKENEKSDASEELKKPKKKSTKKKVSDSEDNEGVETLKKKTVEKKKEEIVEKFNDEPPPQPGVASIKSAVSVNLKSLSLSSIPSISETKNSLTSTKTLPTKKLVTILKIPPLPPGAKNIPPPPDNIKIPLPPPGFKTYASLRISPSLPPEKKLDIIETTESGRDTEKKSDAIELSTVKDIESKTDSITNVISYDRETSISPTEIKTDLEQKRYVSSDIQKMEAWSFQPAKDIAISKDLISLDTTNVFDTVLQLKPIVKHDSLLNEYEISIQDASSSLKKKLEIKKPSILEDKKIKKKPSILEHKEIKKKPSILEDKKIKMPPILPSLNEEDIIPKKTKKGEKKPKKLKSKRASTGAVAPEIIDPEEIQTIFGKRHQALLEFNVVQPTPKVLFQGVSIDTEASIHIIDGEIRKQQKKVDSLRRTVQLWKKPPVTPSLSDTRKKQENTLKNSKKSSGVKKKMNYSNNNSNVHRDSIDLKFQINTATKKGKACGILVNLMKQRIKVQIQYFFILWKSVQYKCNKSKKYHKQAAVSNILFIFKHTMSKYFFHIKDITLALTQLSTVEVEWRRNRQRTQIDSNSIYTYFLAEEPHTIQHEILLLGAAYYESVLNRITQIIYQAKRRHLIRDLELSGHRFSTLNNNELSGIQLDPSVGFPFSNDAQAIFTDLYQLTMMFAYWKAGKAKDQSVFDVYFRKCPFSGEFAVLAGVSEVVRFVNSLRFTETQLDYLRDVLKINDPEFFDYLSQIDGSSLRLYAIKEGTVVFPGVPLIRVEGDLGVCQLIETAVINLLNFPTLIATNAARHRLAAGWDKELLEFGARRAQGLDGAMSASRYCYMGTFDATSNVRAGHLFGIPIRGTHAHAYVTSFDGLHELKVRSLTLQAKGIYCEDFVALTLSYRKQIMSHFPDWTREEIVHDGEITAFIAFAQAFPDSFLTLVDTYDTLASGIPNFLAVGLALNHLGIRPIGIRIDSGDLAYFSERARDMFHNITTAFSVDFSGLKIVASNNINENVLIALNDQKHQIDTFGIGTHLVTCQAQPALGMVYKLAEINGRPCMKLSQEIGKTSVPGKKNLFRLYAKTGEPTVDLIQGASEPPPQPGVRIFCRHLFDSTKRCFVVAQRVEPLLCLVWDRGVCTFQETLVDSRKRCISQLRLIRKDILRLMNPTRYKVSTSSPFFEFFSKMWQETVPVFTVE